MASSPARSVVNGKAISRAIAITLFAVTVALVTAYGPLYARASSVHATVFGFPGATAVGSLAFASMGVLVAIRQRGNAIGWLMLVAGVLLLVTADSQLYALIAYREAGGGLPLAPVAAFGSSLWGPALALLPLGLLLFPDGRVTSRPWRVALGACIVVESVFVVALLAFTTATLLQGPVAVGPDGQLAAFSARVPSTTLGHLFLMSFPLLVIGFAIGAAGLIRNTAVARGERREQMKWFMYAAAVGTVALAAYAVAQLTTGSSAVTQALGGVFVLALSTLPVATAVAIFKYRLYDIDIIISRTLVYGALAVLITGVYVGIAVGVGELVGSGGRPNLGLSILATAIVAVGFQPARERLQRVANRLVYGRRASPYEVLSEFASQVAGSYAADEVLPRMARVLQEGTAADSAAVWLRSGHELRVAAASPDVADGVPQSVAVSVSLPRLPGSTRAVEVRHQGELLGALSVLKHRGETLTPVEEKLLGDLAHQAGLVLKNVGLTADLQRRLEELRASRQRLVSAQDAERRRLERNLHDGAQQHLVALKVKLGLAEILTVKDPEKAKAAITQLKGDTDEALETLRDLARGIYPPLLAEKGLVTALESQARKATIRVDVDGDGVGRYPQDVEATVYFCVLEALQNVQKYAGASRATVRLWQSAGALRFDVEDDGQGFDVEHARRGAGLTNISDRLDALGGALALRSTPGSGTSIGGALPLSTAMPAEAVAV